MKLNNKIKQEIKELLFLMVILILFLLGFSIVSGQNMADYDIDLPEIELNTFKPQNKFVARKQVNNKALVFITGATFTTIGTVQLIRSKNSHFRFDNPKGAIPINPHNLLIGLGLLTISFSFVIS